MVAVGRSTLLVLAVLCSVLLVACSSDSPSPSPTAAASSPPPVAELERLAHRFRSSQTPTKAWWVAVPFSEAQSLLGTEYESVAAGQDPSSPLYAVILNGGFTGGDGVTKYDWAVVVSDADEQTSNTSAIVLADRPQTPGYAWNSLPSSSP
jgi:hypothetical protein